MVLAGTMAYDKAGLNTFGYSFGGDTNVLLKIAEHNNVSKEKVINYFSEINKNKIYSYQNMAKEKNISGVPFFEINDQFVSGASLNL